MRDRLRKDPAKGMIDASQYLYAIALGVIGRVGCILPLD